jgi:hypothetical protein
MNLNIRQSPRCRQCFMYRASWLLMLSVFRSTIFWGTLSQGLELPCKDEVNQCAQWSNLGECTANPGYMHHHCQKSCNICQPQPSDGVDSVYSPRAGEDLGVPQDLIFADGTQPEDIMFLLTKARNYMEFVVLKKLSPGVKSPCKNQKEDCAYWALTQECDSNPECK